MLCAGNARLQGVHIGSDFRTHRRPVSNSRVANGLNFLIYFLCRLRGSSPCLLFARVDFPMRLFLGHGHCVFGILGANGQISELLGESLSHGFSPSSSACEPAPKARRSLEPWGPALSTIPRMKSNAGR